MKATEGRLGRVFVIRLEDGDVVPECIGRSDERPPEPMYLPIDGAHEVVGVGVLAPNEDGKPILHIHAALGRGEKTISGCLRPGVKTWLVGEAILYEIVGADVGRVLDKESNFELLKVEPGGKD